MVRLQPDQRTAQILDAAYQLACDGQLMTMSAKNITRTVPTSCSPSTIKYYFGSLTKLRSAVIAEAIKRNNIEILIVALINKEPAALAAPQEMINRAYESLTNSED